MILVLKDSAKSGRVTVGGEELLIIAGPCAVESEEQIFSTARSVADAGANMLRGGAYKPRTSRHSFQGLGEPGLRLLAAAGVESGLPVITEVVDVRTLDLVAKYADVLQVGSRNMQNFTLLKEIGASKKPVLLKRGMMSTIDEFLLAAEYILAEGNPNVVLCERGIRTFETSTRFTLDLNAVPVLKNRTKLPVIVDPSHGTGNSMFVPAMARAAVACGADGVMLEVHPLPSSALSDGFQALTPTVFVELMQELRLVAMAVKRKLPEPVKSAPGELVAPGGQ